MATQTVYFNNPADITTLQTDVAVIQQTTNAFEFAAVPYNIDDSVTVPFNYLSSNVISLGDPILLTGPNNTALPAYKNDGSESGMSFWGRFGDRADGIQFFPLTGSSTEGLMVANHEIMTPTYLHTGGIKVIGLDGTTGSMYTCYRPYDDCLKEILVHGMSVVHIRKNSAGIWAPVVGSLYNKRYTPITEFDIQGPLRGSTYMQTKAYPAGTKCVGTIDNCGSSKTPWGTYLTSEENCWYFHMSLGGEASVGRTGEELAALRRYRVDTKGNATQCNVWAGAGNTTISGWTGPTDTNFQTSKGLWSSATGYHADPLYGTQYLPTGCFDSFNIFAYGADATEDYRNVLNTFYMVKEIDPYTPNSTPIARTALGRMFHENSHVAPVAVGQPIVLYMNCDSRNEYLYKYVSEKVWESADLNGGLAAGSKYLNTGTLYVAKFALTGTLGTPYGTGAWINLNTTNGTTTYTSGTQITVNSLEKAMVWTRSAADINAATFVDRGEWSAVDPRNNIVYQTFTNNRDRRIAGANYNVTSALLQGTKPIDATSPRAYTDNSTGRPGDQGNQFGGIFRYQCYTGSVANIAGTSIRWDHFLFGCGPNKLTDKNVNLSGLDASSAFSMPDTACFGEYSGQFGYLWMGMDDDLITGTVNPSVIVAEISATAYVGDGTVYTVSNRTTNTGGFITASKDVNTYVGAKQPVARFLVGPNGCEMTGWTETNDGTTGFTAIQHPGAPLDTLVEQLPQQAGGFGAMATQTDDALRNSGFNSSYPNGPYTRPQSTIVAITRRDGQPIV